MANKKANATERKDLPTGDHDRVAMASRLPDGTPHQTPDFEFLGDEDAVREAAEVQLKQQRVSAADTAARGVEATAGVLADEDTSGDGSINPTDAPQDPSIQRLTEIHETAAEGAVKAAETEVAERHQGLGDDSGDK